MSILTDLTEKALDPAMAEFERLAAIRHLDTATCVHGAVGAALGAVLPQISRTLLKEENKYPHAQAAFINAIAEEGTKDEAVHWLQDTWNELVHLRRAIRSLQEPVAKADA